ncbi:MAG: hypothetical protein HWD59_05505 [Coxiellaceae bacterium]|nr:MAG: hypothetical protein HWD59_05505 [Coxiellaceae bacterium]
MKNKLFIYLDTPEQVAWLLCDATGNIVHTLTQSTLADLTTIAATAEVIVVVPATDVLLTTVELPQLNKKQLINAIPYALEEHLLHEPTEYFCCSRKYSAGKITRRSGASNSYAAMDKLAATSADNA